MKNLDESPFTLCMGGSGFGIRFHEEEIANAPAHLIELTATIESIACLARDKPDKVDRDGIRRCIGAIELLSGLANAIATRSFDAEVEKCQA